jgi:hypothetical protein
MMENKANREYKDSVFVALCEDKKRLIEIDNAVSNKNYPPDAALKPFSAMPVSGAFTLRVQNSCIA